MSRDDRGQLSPVAAPKRTLDLHLAGQALGGGIGRVEPLAVAVDRDPQLRLERGVRPAALAPLGQAVVAVERHRERKQGEQRRTRRPA